MKKCPECSGEMIRHVFEGRVYYLCERCSREQIISEIVAMNF
jgi:formamidopyrimidine-DNA glycosylase